MSLTVSLEDNPSVRVTDEVIEARPPDRIAFAAEGVIRPSESLLGRFEGASLLPVRIDVAVDDPDRGDGSDTIEIDLETASLRLGAVDVGIETPDRADLVSGAEALRSITGDDVAASDGSSGVIAFTVEGTIVDASPLTVDRLAAGDTTLSSITFAVDEPVRGDGGSPNDVLFEFTLLGYGIVVRRNGTIEIGTGGGVPDVGLADRF